MLRVASTLSMTPSAPASRRWQPIHKHRTTFSTAVSSCCDQGSGAKDLGHAYAFPHELRTRNVGLVPVRTVALRHMHDVW